MTVIEEVLNTLLVPFFIPNGSRSKSGGSYERTYLYKVNLLGSDFVVWVGEAGKYTVRTANHLLVFKDVGYNPEYYNDDNNIICRFVDNDPEPFVADLSSYINKTLLNNL